MRCTSSELKTSFCGPFVIACLAAISQHRSTALTSELLPFKSHNRRVTNKCLLFSLTRTSKSILFCRRFTNVCFGHHLYTVKRVEPNILSTVAVVSLLRTSFSWQSNMHPADMKYRPKYPGKWTEEGFIRRLDRLTMCTWFRLLSIPLVCACSPPGNMSRNSRHPRIPIIWAVRQGDREHVQLNRMASEFLVARDTYLKAPKTLKFRSQ